MSKTEFTKQWILEKGIPIVKSYHGNLTLRALHYRLVAAGMTNDIGHYKKVVNAMIEARWEGSVAFDDFLDHERESLGETYYTETNVDDSVIIAKKEIKSWANFYMKHRWENQPYYPEIFIEKKALQGVFEKPCRKWDIALNPCKGYPSLTFLHDAKVRFEEAQEQGKKTIILYFGDYDCSGENIPETIITNLNRMGLDDIELRRIALKEEQVIEWELPPAPTKESDTRAAKWQGLGQVELDAVEPDKIVELCEESIEDIFDEDLYDELMEQQKVEKKEFQKIILRDFKTLLD
jgi:hypothetical protein